MYIGGLEPHPLLWEAVANCLDLALGGRPVRVVVSTHADGSASVEDDGPGIALALEPLFVEGHSRPTADGHAPHVHLTVRGVGLAVIGALSERVEVETCDGLARSRQCFGRGKVLTPLEREGSTGGAGTRIRFWPDRALFGRYAWDPTAIRERLHELSALTPGFCSRFEPAAEDFGGDVDLAALIPNRADAQPLHDFPICATATAGEATARIAMRWFRPSPRAQPQLRSFCNLEATERGAHVAAFEVAVGRALARARVEEFGRAYRRAYDAAAPALAAVVAADTISPEWKSPIKDNPTHPDLGEATRRAVEAVLPDWLAAHPAAVDAMFGVGRGADFVA